MITRIFVSASLLVTILGGGILLGEGFVADLEPKPSDVIVVLGSPARPDGTPDATMISRVSKGVELYRKGYASRMIMSGSNVANAFREAQVMADYAETLGVPRASIIIEDRSTDTLENAVCSSIILRERGWESAIVVTSPYHTGRALALFRREGVRAITAASVSPSQLSWRMRIHSIFYEYGAYVYTFIKLNASHYCNS
ncbi:MAG: YdcF family protein [Oscillochloris sp.]|nr:YdcF family protein [Oscillochloris sp.]